MHIRIIKHSYYCYIVYTQKHSLSIIKIAIVEIAIVKILLHRHNKQRTCYLIFYFCFIFEATH